MVQLRQFLALVGDLHKQHKNPVVLTSHHMCICKPLRMRKSFHEKFQPGHAIKFGIKITAYHINSGEVSNIMCLFCIPFRRKEKVSVNSKATENGKYFNKFQLSL